MMEGYALGMPARVVVGARYSEMDVDAISLGRCKLLLKERVLLAEDRPAQIGSRACAEDYRLWNAVLRQNEGLPPPDQFAAKCLKTTVSSVDSYRNL